MKKAVITATVVAGFVAVASADIVNSFAWWNTAAGNLKNNSNVDIAAQGATILTYLSVDGIIDFDAGVPLKETYGDDFLLIAQGNNGPGRLLTGYTSVDDAIADYSGYTAYAIVLDSAFVSYTGVDDVATGTWYANTGIAGTVTDLLDVPVGGTPPPPDQFNVGNVQTNAQVIPEPATIGLMGVAGLGMFLARRKARR